MRSNVLLLAGLASYALGLPSASLEDRTLDLDVGADVNIGGIHGGLDLGVFLGDLLGHGHSPASMLDGLSAHAAAALQAGALGCTAGNIDAHALVELKTWLHGAAHIDAHLKAHLLHWCDAGASATLSVDVCAGLSVFLPTCAEIATKANLFVTVDGIFEAAELEAVAVLDIGAQASLQAFLRGAVHLGADIKAALSLCAAGGVVTSLEADVKAALKVWLGSSDCGLDAHLKATIVAWLEGRIGGQVVALGHLSESALESVSVGATLVSLVEESGILVESAQASLIAFLHSHLAVDLEADIKTVLEACAKGKHAASLSIELRTAIAIWLSGSSCNLGAELKAVVLFWLSFAISADVSVGLHTGLIGDLVGFIEGTVGAILGGGLRGILSILIGGESFLHISLKARAEIIAILSGGTGIELPSGCITIIIEWITGCTLPGSGSGPSTSSMSLPGTSVPVSSTPVSTPLVSPTPTAGSSTSVPAVPTPGSSASGPSGSGSVPTPSGSGSVPTPSGSGSVPTPSSSGSKPSGPGSVPTPSGSGSVPTPSGSGSVPSGPASSPSVVVPVPTGSGSSEPSPSSTPNGVEPVPTGPSAVPPPANTSAPSSTEGVPPAVTSPPTGPTGSGSTPPRKTVYVTTTISVAACQ